MEKDNQFGEQINKTMDDLKTYFNLRLRLIQLNWAEKISVALAKVISSSIAFTFYILFFVFGSFALAYCLGEVFSDTALGFAAVAGFYLLVALTLSVFAKKPIEKKLTDSFVSDFANDQPNSNRHA